METRTSATSLISFMRRYILNGDGMESTQR